MHQYVCVNVCVCVNKGEGYFVTAVNPDHLQPLPCDNPMFVEPKHNRSSINSMQICHKIDINKKKVCYNAASNLYYALPMRHT